MPITWQWEEETRSEKYESYFLYAILNTGEESTAQPLNGTGKLRFHLYLY